MAEPLAELTERVSSLRARSMRERAPGPRPGANGAFASRPLPPPVYAVAGQSFVPYNPPGLGPCPCCAVICCCGNFKVPGLPEGSVLVNEEDKTALYAQLEGIWFPKVVSLSRTQLCCEVRMVPHPAFTVSMVLELRRHMRVPPGQCM